MKLDILQSNFSSALKKAGRFLSTKPQLPILSCFYLEANDEGIFIIATDLQMGIKQKIQGTVHQKGVCVVPAKILNDLVGSLSGNIELTLNAHILSIKTEKVNSTINTFPTQDFPPFPVSEGETVTFPIDFFKRTVEVVTFASGKDETRPILTSVYMSLSENTVVVCTDGYRLAVLHPALKDVKEPKNLLFSAKSIEEVTKIILTEDVKEVAVSLSEGLKQAFFTLPSCQIVMRTLEGEFPMYQKIIPTAFSIEAKMDSDEFEHHVKSAMLFSNEGSNIVQLTLAPELVEVSAKSSVLGEYQSSCAAKINTDEPLKIAFNGRYILDFLQRIPGKECVLKCNDPLKPAEFSCAEIPGYSYIVMPFRMNG